MGSCGQCMTNADCMGHTGNLCNGSTGLCVSGCLTDADCAATDWCNGVAPTPGMCVPKLDNGKPLPSMPASVSTCSPAVGMRVCKSGVCDTKDNACGYAPGDGPCSNDEMCRNDSCNPNSSTCVGPCQKDADCPTADYCATNGSCVPKQPDGSPCTADDQCVNGACSETVCGGPAIGSGNGLICAAQPSRDSRSGGLAAFGLMLAAAGLARRRRR
jgi:MYXO-CTERM domain-containing protein